MIILKCDICKKKVDKLDTIVLYSQKIDYCEDCKEKANKIKIAMNNSIKYYNEIVDRDLREAEKKIMSRRY